MITVDFVANCRDKWGNELECNFSIQCCIQNCGGLTSRSIRAVPTPPSLKELAEIDSDLPSVTFVHSNEAMAEREIHPECFATKIKKPSFLCTATEAALESELSPRADDVLAIAMALREQATSKSRPCAHRPTSRRTGDNWKTSPSSSSWETLGDPHQM